MLALNFAKTLHFDKDACLGFYKAHYSVSTLTLTNQPT